MIEILIALIKIPLIAFTVIVAPLWVICHYRAKAARRDDGTIEAKSEELFKRAETLEQRINNLEILLDRESPDWRTKR